MEVSEEILALFDEIEQRDKYEKIGVFYPSDGPLSLDEYPKHREHYEAGKDYRERLFMAGNRTGKTICGAYETALHLTGLYDKYAPWWQGVRFYEPIDAWVSGSTNETTRDVVQFALLGKYEDIGSGMIPKKCIRDCKPKRGVSEAIELVRVEHVNGGASQLGFKSYQQKQLSFQGTAKHWLWFDEEPPLDIYNEGIIRTATVDGRACTTFTPLMGLSETVLSFLPNWNPDAGSN
jgi:phage terminase large subunit-like protein